jgi:hypothetical protein
MPFKINDYSIRRCNYVECCKDNEEAVQEIKQPRPDPWYFYPALKTAPVDTGGCYNEIYYYDFCSHPELVEG